jgi:hypothetical protein
MLGRICSYAVAIVGSLSTTSACLLDPPQFHCIQLYTNALIMFLSDNSPSTSATLCFILGATRSVLAEVVSGELISLAQELAVLC